MFQALANLYEQDIVSRELGRFGDLGPKRDVLMREAQAQIRAGKGPSEAFSAAAKLLDIQPAGAAPPAAPKEEDSAPPAAGPSAVDRLRSIGSPTPPTRQEPAKPEPTDPHGIAKKWNDEAMEAFDRGDTKAMKEIAEAAKSRMEQTFSSMI